VHVLERQRRREKQKQVTKKTRERMKMKNKREKIPFAADFIFKPVVCVCAPRVPGIKYIYSQLVEKEVEERVRDNCILFPPNI
jgi:hypothetical protein